MCASVSFNCFHSEMTYEILLGGNAADLNRIESFSCKDVRYGNVQSGPRVSLSDN